MSGKFGDAVADLTRAIELEPKNVDHYANRADARLRIGDSEGALRDASRALDLDPGSYRAYYALGQARNARGEFAKALENLDRVVELNPRAPAAYLERAAARDGLGNRDGAESDRIQAIRLDEEAMRKIGARQPETHVRQGNGKTSLPAIAVGDPVYLEFCHRIEESISKEGGSWVDQKIDVAALIDRALRGLQGIPRVDDFVRKHAFESATLGTLTAREISETDGRYRFLHLRSTGNRRQAVFRSLRGDEFKYQEFLIEPSADGSLRIVDVYLRGLGDWFSEAIRSTAITLSTKRVGMGLFVPNEYVSGMEDILSMEPLRRSGKADAALKVYFKLPPFLQKAKIALASRLAAAREQGDEASRAALEALQTAFPADPSVSILIIAPLTDLRRFAEALAAVDALENVVGRDPYLDFKRSEILFMAEDYGKAQEVALKAIREEKTLIEPYQILVKISIREKKYSDTARWLTSLENDARVQLADPTQISELKEFVASPEYRAWVKSRGK
jgi:tetratricopeptide (TPR) repeat protein